MTARRLFAALFVIALFAMAARETLDPDMWWHLRAGEAILQRGIPRHDLFSFTVPHHEWVTHEWLSQLFMWGVYRLAGFTGLIIVFAALIALTFWLIYRVSAGRPFLAAFVVLLAAVVSAIVWGARPQIFNLLLTAVFIHIIERRQNGELPDRALWLLPPLMILWANLHSGYLLGVAVLVVYTVGEALRRFKPSSSVIRHPSSAVLYLSVTVVSFLAAALNPSGAELWIYPFLTLGSPSMQIFIQEWHSPDFHLSMFWPFGLMMALGVAGWLVSRQRPSWTELLLFGGTAAAGLISARNIPIFAVVAAPIVSRHWLYAAVGTRAYPLLSGQKPEPTPPAFMQALNWGILFIALLGAGVWTAVTAIENEAAIAERYPVAAVDFIEEAGLTEARIYNSYNWGGYLIWRGLPVFVDGRADVYGDDFLFEYRQTFDVAVNWQEPLEKYDVAYVLMERGSLLTVMLTASDGWDEIYTDEIAQMFVRTGNANP
ncbi:MAG: hypothetical protein GY803_13275 [Chloroflexi bacterium]|nr:hypothetical protein [Chloroflexota bacterium]